MAGYGSRFAFSPMAKIDVADSVCTVVSNSPPDCCIPIGSTPFPLLKQKPPTPMGWWLLFGAGYGSRTRLICLGSRDSTDELILRNGVIIAKGNWKFKPNLSTKWYSAPICVTIKERSDHYDRIRNGAGNSESLSQQPNA